MTSWKETSPGRFERPFDSIERFFLALARGSFALNKEHWAVSFFAQFDLKASQQDTESALRHAWKTIRYDHPQLACIASEETKIYVVPDQLTLDAWLDETFIVAPPLSTKEDLMASFRPSTMASLHYLPHTSEIVIHTSHWRIDFIGAISLLQNLFKAVANPRQFQFGDEAANLSPSRDQAAKYSSLDHLDPSVQVKQREEAATDLAMQLLGNLPSIGLPAQNLNRTPGGTRRSELVLDISTTSAIVIASKKRGFTVTTALHAALIVALEEVAPPTPSTLSKYATFGIFNVRPLLSPTSNDASIHPAAVHILGLPLVLQLSTYADLALQLKQYYKQPLPPSANSHIEKDIIVPYTCKMADIVGQARPEDLPASREPLLSSVGILDGYLKPKYGDIAVKNFGVVVEMTTPQIVCYLWTWQGKMTLSASYNETFYDQVFVHKYLERVIDILKTELAIQVA